MTDEPHRMLPLCSVCGQRVPHGSATHGGGVWTCLRCWGGWLAGVPEQKDPGSFEIASVTFEPKPDALRWDDSWT